MSEDREMYVPMMEQGTLAHGIVRFPELRHGVAITADFTVQPAHLLVLLQQLADASNAAGEALTALEAHLAPLRTPVPGVYVEGISEDQSMLTPVHQALIRQIACVQWLTARIEHLRASVHV